MIIKTSTTVTIFYEKKKKIRFLLQKVKRGGRGRDLFSLSTSSFSSTSHLETLLKGLHLLLFHASHVDEIGILDESWILWPIAATRARRATWTASIRPAKRWTTAGPNDFLIRSLRNIFLQSLETIHFLPLLFFQSLSSYHITSKEEAFKVCQRRFKKERKDICSLNFSLKFNNLSLC